MNQEDQSTFNSRLYEAISDIAGDFVISKGINPTREEFTKAFDYFLDHFFRE